MLFTASSQVQVYRGPEWSAPAVPSALVRSIIEAKDETCVQHHFQIRWPVGEVHHDGSAAVSTELDESEYYVLIMGSVSTHLMGHLSRSKVVACKLALGALHDAERIAILGDDPECPFLGANAAVALAHALDFRKVDLVDKSGTVAVAAIGSLRLFGDSHIDGKEEHVLLMNRKHQACLEHRLET